jgi:ribonuclease VapC
MIVVDTSALVAVASEEPDRVPIMQVLLASDRTVLSAFNYVETGVVLVSRGHLENRAELDVWLAELGVTVHPGPEDSAKALDAYLAYGKGRHPARLNLADCFAYALAKQLDAPLLYKSDDFPLTDVRSALT